MSYFTVVELLKFKIAETGIAYKLPKTISAMLCELEKQLDITESATDTTTSHAKKSYVGSSSDSSSSGFGRHNKKDGYSGFGPYSSSIRKKDSTSASGGEWIDAKQYSKSSSKAAPPAADPDWEAMRAFKATKIESKTGIEKTVNDIRVALNKISSANYEKQKNIVLEFVNGYFNGPDADANVNDADTGRISKAIFDIASTNKFYSEIYAKLYKELIEVSPVFRGLLDDFVSGFTNMSGAPIYVDPDVDYDGFCVYSKACDVRKSTSTFLVNCMKIGLILPDQICDILCEFVAYVEANMQDESFVKLVEEVIENVFIISTACQTELKTTAKWDECALPAISKFASQKNDGRKGLSSRAAFKCMDIVAKF